MKVKACGDCAGALFKLGGKSAPKGEIGLGVGCEVHPSPNTPQATNIVIVGARKVARYVEEARATWERERADRADPFPSPVSGIAPPQSWACQGGRVVPLRPAPSETEIALRLLASWTADDNAHCDESIVKHAVSVARLVLHHTKGR